MLMTLRCCFVASYFTCGFSGLWSFLLIFFLYHIYLNKGRGVSHFELDFSYLKRAVRPDKIGSRVAPSDRPRLGHSSLPVFNFFIFSLNFLKKFKIIRP
jgi:hypothetical protein